MIFTSRKHTCRWTYSRSLRLLEYLMQAWIAASATPRHPPAWYCEHLFL